MVDYMIYYQHTHLLREVKPYDHSKTLFKKVLFGLLINVGKAQTLFVCSYS